jgi:hypothetical protein
MSARLLAQRSGAVLIKRVANALIHNTALNPLADAYFRWTTLGVANAELDLLKGKMGGLWVGGTLKVSDDAIVFDANALNRLFQGGELQLTIPMGKISAVNLRFGILTRIIDVTYGSADLRTSFRCFGARELAGYIGRASAAAEHS